MLCWRFTIHNALSTYVLYKSLLEHRNVGHIKLDNCYGFVDISCQRGLITSRYDFLEVIIMMILFII